MSHSIGFKFKKQFVLLLFIKFIRQFVDSYKGAKKIGEFGANFTRKP